MDHCVHIKNSSKGPPLAQNSGHTAAVHKTWRLGGIRRHAMRATSFEDFDSTRLQFLERFRRFHIPPAFILTLLKQETYWRRYSQFVNRNEHKPPTWLVLPYHPVTYCSNIKGALKDMCNTAMDAGWPSELSLNVSGRNGSKPLWLRVRQAGRKNKSQIRSEDGD